MAASFADGEAPIPDGFIESLMVNLQYLTEPAYIPLSSHQEHGFCKLGVVGERQRWLEPCLPVPGRYRALVLTERLTVIFQLQLAGAGQGLGMTVVRLACSQPGMPLLWTFHFFSLVYFSMHL